MENAGKAIISSILFFILILIGGIQPARSQEPWATPQGRACIDKWANEAMRRINSHKGSSDFNARKLWFINRYGVLNGNPKYGPTSTAAPDDFRQYGNNKHRYMWRYWHVASGYWRWPEWRAAGVPHIRPYVLSCIRAAGGGVAGAQPPSGGAITGHNPAVQTPNRDVVSRSERLAGDRVNDWMFGIRLRASGTVASITVRNTNGPYSVWDTIPRNGRWLLGVLNNKGQVLNRSDGSVNFSISGTTDLYLLAADNGVLKAGKTSFKVIVKFADGTTLERNIGTGTGGGLSSDGKLELNTDRPGSDFRSFFMSEPKPVICQQACLSDKRCRAWTYVRPGIQGSKAKCWLKHSVPQPRSNNCCVSGAK